MLRTAASAGSRGPGVRGYYFKEECHFMRKALFVWIMLVAWQNVVHSSSPDQDQAVSWRRFMREQILDEGRGGLTPYLGGFGKIEIIDDAEKVRAWGTQLLKNAEQAFMTEDYIRAHPQAGPMAIETNLLKYMVIHYNYGRWPSEEVMNVLLSCGLSEDTSKLVISFCPAWLPATFLELWGRPRAQRISVPLPLVPELSVDTTPQYMQEVRVWRARLSDEMKACADYLSLTDAQHKCRDLFAALNKWYESAPPQPLRVYTFPDGQTKASLPHHEDAARLLHTYQLLFSLRKPNCLSLINGAEDHCHLRGASSGGSVQSGDATEYCPCAAL